MSKLIIPAQVNKSAMRNFVDKAREILNQIDELLEDDSLSQGKLLSLFLRHNAELRDLTQNSIRDWAMEWIRTGAKVSVVASSIRMSWSGVKNWWSAYVEEHPEANRTLRD